ncbi:hypothetical protein AMST5_00237 [freshwater sediment metagenome]|uniref:Uncharacterized protein n=1 Tax=freshwater sediment metagenome TaxID=556182 RepID=A0AA48M075_9ZZZZ
MLSKIASLEVCAEAHLLREMYALAGSGKGRYERVDWRREVSRCVRFQPSVPSPAPIRLIA